MGCDISCLQYDHVDAALPNSFLVTKWDAGKKLHVMGASCRKNYDADFGIRNYGYCIMLNISGNNSF